MVWVLGGGAWIENGNGHCYLIEGVGFTRKCR